MKHILNASGIEKSIFEKIRKTGNIDDYVESVCLVKFAEVYHQPRTGKSHLLGFYFLEHSNLRTRLAASNYILVKPNGDV